MAKSPMQKMSDAIKKHIITDYYSRDTVSNQILMDLYDLSRELKLEEKEMVIEAHGPGFRNGLRPSDYYYVKFEKNDEY